MEMSQQQQQNCVYFNIFPPDWFVTKGWLWLCTVFKLVSFDMCYVVLLFILEASLLNISLASCLANVATPSQRRCTSYLILRDSKNQLWTLSLNFIQLNDESSKLE